MFAHPNKSKSPAAGPFGEGPIPDPTSFHHASLFPEIEVQGGGQSFAHDAGMVWGSPRWTLAGLLISEFSREMLPALFEHRGLTSESPIGDKAALAFDFYLAYLAYGVLLEKPEEWKGLEGKEFHPPRLETGSETIWEQKVEVAMIYFWTMKKKMTDNPKEIYMCRMTMPNPNYEPDESKLDHWIEWERKCAKIRLTRRTDYKHGDHYSYQLGYVITVVRCSGTCCAESERNSFERKHGRDDTKFSTTADGTALFTPNSSRPSPSFGPPIL